MTSVVVFDYGFGNVRSMVRALANLGLDTTLTSDYRQALEADGMVVPGVGAFTACMTGLREVSGDRVILDRLRAGRPVLGVCVGEQIMFERGNEHADTTEGLGLIGGTERFYFVHSYAAMSATAKDLSAEQVDLGGDEHITWCTYGRSRFVAAYERGPLSVTQFHPEKSADAGKQLLRNWVGTFSK